MISRVNLLKLSILAILLAVVFCLRWILIPPEEAGDLVVRTGYYFVGLNFLLFIFYFGRYLLSVINLQTVRRHLPGLIVCLILTLITHIQEPHRFKVLNDEYALLNNSMAMHFYQKAGLMGQAHIIDGQLQHDNITAGKRSLFFQTLLSVVHSVSGYRPANAFVLNFLITGFFFVALYCVLRSLVRQPLVVYFGMMATASIPLLPNIATSAGYDLLNAAMILFFLLVATSYLKSPTSDRQALFVLTCLLLAQVRYESILYLIALASVVGYSWLKHRELKLSWVSACSPVFLFIPLMLNAHMFANEALQDASIRGSERAFMSTGFLSTNLAEAARFFFIPGSSHLNSVPVSLLGVIGFAFFVIVLVRLRGHPSSEQAPVLYSLIPVTIVALLCFLIMTMNFWGVLTDPQATRFAMPIYLLGVIWGTVALSRLLHSPAQSWTAICLGFILLGSGALTIDSRRAAADSQPIPRHHEWIIEYAMENPEPATLYACDGTLGLVAFQQAVLPIEVITLLPVEIAELVNSGLYDSVIVFELLAPSGESGKLVPAPTTSGFNKDAYTYEVVAEQALSEPFISRAFKLTGRIGPDGNVYPFRDR